MNKEEIEKIIELFDKGYCNECNELNCLGGEPSSRKVANCIRNLYQALLDIKEVLDNNYYVSKEMCVKAIDKIENIVNKALGDKENE